MAPLALFNEGVPAHFFHLMEVPTMRLPNVKLLLRWPSCRMHIYGFVENRTFLEQLDRMGYQRIFKYYGHCYGSFISEGRHRRQSGAIVEEGIGPDD